MGSTNVNPQEDSSKLSMKEEKDFGPSFLERSPSLLVMMRRIRGASPQLLANYNITIPNTYNADYCAMNFVNEELEVSFPFFGGGSEYLTLRWRGEPLPNKGPWVDFIKGIYYKIYAEINEENNRIKLAKEIKLQDAADYFNKKVHMNGPPE